MDRIASQGLRYNRVFSTALCSPTRAGTMTGRYAIRFGMQRAVCRPFLDAGVPPEEETLPEGRLTRDGLLRLHNSPQNGSASIYWMEAEFIEDVMVRLFGEATFADLKIPFVAVATKVDKLKKQQLQRQLATMRRHPLLDGVELIPYSSLNGTGRKELDKALERIVEERRQETGVGGQE